MAKKKKTPRQCGFCNTADALESGEIISSNDPEWFRSRCRCNKRDLVTEVEFNNNIYKVGDRVSAQLKQRKWTNFTEGMISEIVDGETICLSSPIGTRVVGLEWVKK